MPETKYDWIKIKQDFYKSDINEVCEFMRQTIGKDGAEDGNVARQTAGWTEDKKEYRRRENMIIEETLRKDLIEKLKVKLEDVLAAKNVSYNLLIGYLRIHAKILKGDALTADEENFLKRFPVGNIDTINKWLHIELGLPTNITELQGSKEKPLNLITLLDEARKIKEEDNNADKGGES